MEVLDEPLYANFLRATGVDRPYRQELLSKMDPDGNKVVKEVIWPRGQKVSLLQAHLKATSPKSVKRPHEEGKAFHIDTEPSRYTAIF